MSWSSGWPACPTSEIVTVVRSDGLRLPMRRQVAVMTKTLIDRTEAMGYDVNPDWTWGFACRPISGTNRPSNHSRGLAVDLNAPRNPYASASWHRRNARGTFPFGLRIVCDIPESVIRLWEANGWGWGGRYKTKPDPMHLEFEGTERDAAIITARLSPLTKPPTTSRPPTSGDPEVPYLESDRDRMIRIEEQLTGKTDGSLRHFIQDQDKATRKYLRGQIEEEGQVTRAGTLRAIVNQTEVIKAELDALFVKIKRLADRPPG